MKTKYLDFLKLNENITSIIGLAEIEKLFKKIFDDAKVSSVKTLYSYDEEKEVTKLIITINNLFFEETNILFIKFIFIVDDKKRKLKKNKMFYLYDINSNFREVKFNDITDLELKLNSLLNEQEFGKDIKELSDVSVTMATSVNTWLKDNNIDNLSVYNITYHPIVDNMPCESLFFKFEINIDDSRTIDLNVRKIEDNEYKITFREGDWFHNVDIDDMKALIQTIGETIKNYIV